MAENSTKPKFHKVRSIIKFDLLNMSFNLVPVPLVGDDGPNTHIFSVHLVGVLSMCRKCNCGIEIESKIMILKKILREKVCKTKLNFMSIINI